MKSIDDPLIREIMSTVGVAGLIYATTFVFLVGLDVLGLNIHPVLGFLTPMGIVFCAFTVHYYRVYE